MVRSVGLRSVALSCSALSLYRPSLCRVPLCRPSLCRVWLAVWKQGLEDRSGQVHGCLGGARCVAIADRYPFNTHSWFPLPLPAPPRVAVTCSASLADTRLLAPCTTGACSDWPNGFRLVHQGIQRLNKWGKWTLDISHVDSFDPGLCTAQFRLTRPTLDGGFSSEHQKKKGQYILPCCYC